MITTVFFDMGSTLEYIRKDIPSYTAGTEKIRAVLETNGIYLPCSNQQLLEKMLQGREAYGEWRKGSNIELSPEEIWSRFMLREQPIDREQLLPIAETLANTWENHTCYRILRPEAMQMLEGLRERGYHIGIISNNSSRTQVFERLRMYQILPFMESVSVSACVGYAKPHPMIFRHALDQMDVDAASCVHVGDNLTADIYGAKQAGFAKAVWISADADRSIRPPVSVQPDLEITSLSELLPWLDEQSAR